MTVASSTLGLLREILPIDCECIYEAVDAFRDLSPHISQELRGCVGGGVRSLRRRRWYDINALVGLGSGPSCAAAAGRSWPVRTR
jgi:hypothetical protein